MNPPHVHFAQILTPPGAGAIGVIRVTGSDVTTLVSQALRFKQGGNAAPTETLSPGRIRYASFVDGDEIIDEVLVSLVEGAEPPALDISAHGGVRVLERILQVLERLGAPLRMCLKSPLPRGGEGWVRGQGRDISNALPSPQPSPWKGEGVLNHALREGDYASFDVWPSRDRVDAEAIHALSQAHTQRTVRFLAWQRMFLPSCILQLANRCATDPGGVGRSLMEMMAGFPMARILLDGATVALVGPPNSGKSTLFNALLGRPAALVSPQPGTTRDWIAEPVEIRGVPVTLVDTAGEHDVDDPLEQRAMRSGRALGEGANVCLLLLDGSEPLSCDSIRVLNACRRWPSAVVVLTKADLGASYSERSLPVPDDDRESLPVLRISAERRQGMDELADIVLHQLGFRERNEMNPCLFTHRQIDAAQAVLACLAHDPRLARLLVLHELLGQSPSATHAS